MVLHHLDPILRNNFSCRSKSMEKTILAVTDPRERIAHEQFLPPLASPCAVIMIFPCLGLGVVTAFYLLDLPIIQIPM